MKPLAIVKVPAPVLSDSCENYKPEEINDELRALIDQMYLTMEEADGVGLAAPQVGLNKRLFVVDTGSKDEGAKAFAVINPEVLDLSGEQTFEEGCLSVPGYFRKMNRSAQIEIRYLDEFGTEQNLKADGFLAVVLQHELDHIDGRTIISSLGPMTRSMVIKKMEKRLRQS